MRPPCPLTPTAATPQAPAATRTQARPGRDHERRTRAPGTPGGSQPGRNGTAARPAGPAGAARRAAAAGRGSPEPQPPWRPPGKVLTAPSAVLDEAHLGDIEGALGRIRVGDDDQRHGLRRRLVTFLAIVGPGLIVMVGDNDAGGVATYAQAGQNYGYTLLWVLLLLVPVLIVNQEMVVRLGAVTGVGHARLINERFGRFWGWFSVGDLFLLNFLTITTEFIGVSLALAYFGVSKYIAVPIAAAVLVVITASGSFRRWERAMLAVHRRQPGADPAGVPVPPGLRRQRLPPRRARHPGRHQLGRDPAHHRDRRHHRGAVAAVLPAVQRDRQADHAPVHGLRARRHRARLGRRGRRRGRDR